MSLGSEHLSLDEVSEKNQSIASSNTDILESDSSPHHHNHHRHKQEERHKNAPAELRRELNLFEQLYQAARDENELLEFKNYELQFKIQELEQNHQHQHQQQQQKQTSKSNHNKATKSNCKSSLPMTTPKTTATTTHAKENSTTKQQVSHFRSNLFVRPFVWFWLCLRSVYFVNARMKCVQSTSPRLTSVLHSEKKHKKLAVNSLNFAMMPMMIFCLASSQSPSAVLFFFFVFLLSPFCEMPTNCWRIRWK